MLWIKRKIFATIFFLKKFTLDWLKIEKFGPKIQQILSVFSSKFIHIFRNLSYFFHREYGRLLCWIMKFIEKIDRVPPRDFDQFWIILQILEPNEDLGFFEIFEKTRFVSSRVWQIIVLNYDFIFQKNCHFLIFQTLICFHELEWNKACHTEQDLNKISNFSIASFHQIFIQKKW